MGLNGCLQFIRNKFPHLLTNEHISKYAHQRVIVDIASYIYKYACIHGLDSNAWTNSFINLILLFKTNKVNPIIVFDGKPPVEKSDELGERKEKKNQTLDKINLLETAFNNYNSNSYTQDDIDTLKSIVYKIESKGKSIRRLLINEAPILTSLELSEIKDYISKLKQTVVFITPSHFDKMKHILNTIGVPFIQAIGEAEGYCCFLVKEGIGKAVVSCDTDCIAHGATNIIFNIDTSGYISHLNINKLYEDFKLDENSIKDFGILIGCDYNRKHKIPNIGPVSALKLLQKHNKIENIPNIVYDIDEINKIRLLFTVDGDKDIIISKQDINLTELENLVKNNNLDKSIIPRLLESQNKQMEFTYFNQTETENQVETEENSE